MERGVGFIGNPLERRSAESAFVGRAVELELLQRSLGDATQGRPRLVLVAGEPGIGKSRLVDEFSTRAKADGAWVLRGRAHDDDICPPFWPWLQMIRQHLKGSGCSRGGEAAKAARRILELLPQWADDGSAAAPAATPAPRSRFSLFDSVLSFVTHAAEVRPLVLCFDDVHAADAPTLALLEYVLRSLEDERVMVASTFRDTEVGGNEHVAKFIASHATSNHVRMIQLSGLSAAQVEELIADSERAALPAAELRRLLDTTGGNPFFVEEIARCWRSGEIAGDARISATFPPASVQFVVERRLARLPTTARAAVQIAALLGVEVRTALLRRVWEGCGEDPASIPAAIDIAVAARILDRSDNRPGVLRFHHALVRDAAAQQLEASKRAALHRTIGDLIAALDGAQSNDRAAEIAFHYARCGDSAEDIERALTWSVRAAEYAEECFAHDAATVHYEQALELGQLKQPPNATEQCRLLLRLARAFDDAGDPSRALATYRRASESARRIGNPELFARAALGRAGNVKPVASPVDEALVSLLRDARDLLRDGPAALHAEVTARLAWATYYRPGSEAERESLCTEAIAEARQVGDSATIAAVLNSAHWATWNHANLDSRLSRACELVELARQVRSPELEMQGHNWLGIDLLARGDAAEATRHIIDYERLSRTVGTPWQRSFEQRFRCVFEAMAGNIADAKVHAENAHRIGRALDDRAALWVFGAQQAMLRILQGRWQEAVDILGKFAAAHVGVHVWGGALAAALARCGRRNEATQQLSRMMAAGIERIPRDNSWLATVCGLAEAAALLDRHQEAAILLRTLRPHRDQLVVVGNYIGCFGSTARYLAMLAATLGSHREACELFEAALVADGRVQHLPALAFGTFEFARFLSRHGEASDGPRIQTLLSDADRLARRISADSLRNDIAAAMSPPAPVVEVIATPSPADNRIERRGDYWEVVFDGTASHLKNTRGMQYLAALLRAAGTDVHAADIARIESSGTANGSNGAERARLAVAKALRSALRCIESANPELGRHFAATIRTGYYCCYRPDPRVPIRWLIRE